jgi:glycosyltransferase involved in cell wall biosynthesis
MLIVTNFHRFPLEWTASCGETGRTAPATSYRDFVRYRKQADAVYLVNCNPRLTFQLAAAALLPGPRPPLTSVDLILRRPASLPAHLTMPVKRFLLSRVDLFINYFRDLHAYQEIYGIGDDRSCFVPFKSNLSDRHRINPLFDGEYVLCFGRSLRDFDTFFAAMETLDYPAAIAEPMFEELKRHSARFSRPVTALPLNIRVLKDDGSEGAQLRILSGAKLVVLPILKISIVASGISTCLNAMMLGKCVIGSEGPGMTDVFTAGEVLTVVPENPEALAAMIRRAWEDRALRESTAAAGYAYALQAGGEAELYQRIIDQVVAWRRDSGEGRGTGLRQ